VVLVTKLGLPDAITTCLFDLDGVLTDTAAVHDRAWKQMFDQFLQQRDGEGFVPFDADRDYGDFVDGRPRNDGVRDFLQSRHISLPEGDGSDGPDKNTISGLANRKNVLLLHAIDADGVTVFGGSRQYLEAARDGGLGRFVVSSSANTEQVLKVTGLADLVQGRIDGVTITQQHLHGKPAPDSFLAGAKLAGVTPSQAAVFEDALAGVEAGRAGNFGIVVGVNRLNDQHGADLREHGADIVVRDLSELLG
jgi:beta-phosphoglucomutase family hydrolase